MLVEIRTSMARYSLGRHRRSSHAEDLHNSRGMSGLRQCQDTLLFCFSLFLIRHCYEMTRQTLEDEKAEYEAKH